MKPKRTSRRSSRWSRHGNTGSGTKPLTQLEFSDRDIKKAERIARRLGYTQTAYTSSSDLWGLFCLPDRSSQHGGCIIKTKEFGLMFVQSLDDLNIEG